MNNRSWIGIDQSEFAINATVEKIESIVESVLVDKNKYELMDLIDNVFTVVNLLEQMGEIYKISATGTFPKSRQEVIGIAASYLQLADVEYTDKITKDVRLLVVGDGPSSKLDKAKKLNIEIKYFDDIVNGR